MNKNNIATNILTQVFDAKLILSCRQSGYNLINRIGKTGQTIDFFYQTKINTNDARTLI